MATPDPPRVFISYSHESPQHEEKVFRLSQRLIDRYESTPEEGWPFWMERKIREAD
jgi:hypothetical protein